ncbi:transmembrane emp24 domain-containing protein p24delta3-like [Eucalyptus grandis]|uniref:transmembrane emp24 domain-containing protein p24delta3-like n=1 Tax=Eucalyptus grandis TaxID=71139 RepID=UPI00192EB58F|nr:transmembrane emp24 domain-containing protein p24delta3-like [Eucalyptus grandis]
MVRGKVLLSIIIMLCFACDVLVEKGHAIWLNLPAGGTKCVSELIQSNVIVMADYLAISDHESDHSTLSVKVTSPYGNILHRNENVTNGQFTFTTSEAGIHEACLRVDGNNQGVKEVSVLIDWRIGIAAKDWESVAKKEKIQVLELELKKLEGQVDAILLHMAILKEREADMRIVSDRTNARVAQLSIMSLGVCITVSGFQLWHLKRFFRKKKLI